MLINHRQRRQWQPVISFLVGIISLVLFIIILFGAWKMLMPSSTQNVDMQPASSNLKTISEQLRSDVYYLSNEIGERNMHRRGSMDKTAEWISERLSDIGYWPKSQHYEISEGQYRGKNAKNIIAELKGTENPDEIIVIGAHYDSVKHSPGANDNASAVAVLLALADWFSERHQPRTVRFLFFANEEPPFFHTKNMGSYAYARISRELNENILSMIALDGLGYYNDEAGSQQYPFPGIGFMYPDKANFIGFVTNLNNRKLLNETIEAFRETATIPSEGAALPGFLPGVYWSDHWSFWEHDYNALLITDTLLYRYPHYHSPTDTPERLDYERMARVTIGLVSATEYLASNY